MLAFLADENFHGDILRGAMLRLPNIDIVRVQDTELSGADDSIILEWAAMHHRVILTHDVNTMICHALARVAASAPMPGVIAVAKSLSIGFVIDELLLIAQCGSPEDFDQQIHYITLSQRGMP